MIKIIKHDSSGQLTNRKPLRLWPGVVIVILQWLLRFAVPAIVPGDIATIIGFFGGLLGGLAVIVWWAFFSRANHVERWGAIVLMAIALVATSYIIDKSLATAMQGMMFPMYSVPVMSLFFVVWAVATRHLSNLLRRVTMIASILVACGVFAVLRTDGMTGDARQDFSWRWAETAEERLLSQTGNEPAGVSSAPVVAESQAGWPGFRGAGRDGIVHDVRINTDWSASPPAELWRRSVGPGCSSFAVSGNLLYTQEQRGDDEVVSCYNLTTGEPVWIHRDSVRFWDSHAGVGPRSTPTLSNGFIFTMGATGILNVLNAGDGTVVWSRNAATDTGTKDSGWGFTSSPLVVDSLVIVAATGKLAAYDIATGESRWTGPDGGDSYSSPHLLTIGGVAQVLLMSAAGVTSVSTADGSLLWKQSWPNDSRILQPALIPDDNILISGGMGAGMRRIAIKHSPDGWSAEEVWTSDRMIPHFNDFVMHNGYAFGYDGQNLACIDIRDGSRMWKGSRYGGQILLLADQGLLIVLTEKGGLALVEASPDRFNELTRFQAIEGKTWNHPVLAGDILVVRNAIEMAAFRITSPEKQ